MSILREFIEQLLEDEISKLKAPKGQTVTVNPGSDIGRDVEPDVFDMIQKSYAKIGGHAKIKSPGDIGAEYSVWDLIDADADPEPDVARLSSPSPTSGGLKGGVVATDGSPEAKAALMGMLKTFYSTAGNWSEVSGAMANILIKKLGFKPISDETKVRKLLGGKEITWNGSVNPEGDAMGVDGWYTRKIGGVEHTKIIVGNV